MYIGQDYSVTIPILINAEDILAGERLTQAVIDEPCAGTRSIIKVEVAFITTTATYETVVDCRQMTQ